jgi:DNA-binding beta-propeller fold protein YncE
MRRRGKFLGLGVATALALAALVVPGTAAAFGPVASIGSDGEAAGQLSAPSGMAVAADGSVYVADTGNDRVSVFGPDGTFRFAFAAGVGPGGVCTGVCGRGTGGDGAGALKGPEGIAISGAGDVYVSEPANDRVSVFSAQGTFLFAFGLGVNPGGGATAEERDRCTAVGGCRAGGNERGAPLPGGSTTLGPEGALGGPSGIAIGSGRVFVAENTNNRVSAFGPLGEFLYTFGTEVQGVPPFESRCTTECEIGTAFWSAGPLSGPAGLTLLPNGDLAVAEAGNPPAAKAELESHRVDVFTPEGEFVRGFGREVSPAGANVCTTESECKAGAVEGAAALSQPQSIAVGPGGAIYVGDTKLERVSQYGADGQLVRTFGAGVLDGSAAFQLCSAETGCHAGLQSTVPGATPMPFGLADGCRNDVLVAESTSGLARVERFGEPEDPATGPCAPKPGPQPAPIVARLVPSNFFTLGRLARDRGKGTATIQVAVPVAGGLALAGRGVHPVTRSAGAAGLVALPVRLFGKARKGLLRSGRRKARLAITFTPEGGTPRTETRHVVLLKKTQAKRRGR